MRSLLPAVFFFISSCKKEGKDVVHGEYKELDKGDVYLFF
jgi:hypothetical protein